MTRPPPEILVLLVWSAAWDWYVVKSPQVLLLRNQEGEPLVYLGPRVTGTTWSTLSETGFESRQPSAGRVSLGKPTLYPVAGQKHPKEKS